MNYIEHFKIFGILTNSDLIGESVKRNLAKLLKFGEFYSE